MSKYNLIDTNGNIFCKSLESEAQETDIPELQPPMDETFVPGPPLKSDHGARPKIPSYPQARRPAGGMSRPLPSPGEIVIYHNILGTII